MGSVLAVSKPLNQANNTMRPVAAEAVVCHCDGGADSMQLLPWGASGGAATSHWRREKGAFERVSWLMHDGEVRVAEIFIVKF